MRLYINQYVISYMLCCACSTHTAALWWIVRLSRVTKAGQKANIRETWRTSSHIIAISQIVYFALWVCR